MGKSEMYLFTSTVVSLLLLMLLIDIGLVSFLILLISVNSFLFIAYKQIVSNAYNKTLVVTVFFLFILLGTLLIFWINNVAINKGTEAIPYLPGDGLSYFLLAKEITDGTKVTDISLNYAGYPLVLSALFKVFGPYLIFGLLLNLFLLAANILLVAKSAFLIYEDKRIFDLSIFILLGISQFLATGFMLLKDGFIVLSITLAFFAGAKYIKKGSLKSSACLLTISLVTMGLFRSTLIFAPVIIFLLFALEKRKNKLQLLVMLTPVIMIAVAVAGKYALSERSLDDSLEFAASNTIISGRLENNAGVISAVLSGYDNWGVAKKAAFLPITGAIQYITPFDVYNIKPVMDFPYYLISKNYQIVWLVYLGPLFIFSVVFSLKNKRLFTGLQLRILSLAIILCMIPAFIYGGAIPRYAVPFIPLFVPSMAQVFVHINNNKLVKTNWSHFLLYMYISFLFLFALYVVFKIL